jgi:hypothetical protein
MAEAAGCKSPGRGRVVRKHAVMVEAYRDGGVGKMEVLFPF